MTSDERAADQDRRAGHRQRPEAVDDALGHVVGHADRRGRRGEHDRLGEDPGHQELAVVAAAGERDRAAEHEREQQHEHDRLEDREDRQLRDPRDALQVAPGDDQAVAGATGAGRRTAGRVVLAVAAVPARLRADAPRRARSATRNTSSSVGRRRPMSSIAIAASSRSRTTWTSPCAPPLGGDVSRRVCSSSCGLADAVGGEELGGPGPGRRWSWTITSIRSPPTWDLSSSAVPRAMILPWSTTAIVSASSSASSRYWVVSSSVVPSRTRPADDVPHAQAAARVEAGRRLVEEQQPRVADQRAGRGRAGGACRPSRS